MATRKVSPSKVAVVAILDFALTLVLVIDIICFTVYPVWAHHYIETGAAAEAEHPLDGVLLYPHQIRYKRPQTPKISGPVLWTFLGAVILFGLIAALAAAALLKSTSEKVNPDEALQIIRFWTHCNLLTLLMTMIGFFSMLILWLEKYRIGFPIPTLFYFGIRLIFTWAIYLQLRAVKGPPLDASVLGPTIQTEEREAARNPGSGMYYNYRVRCAVPRSSVDLPSMGLVPYRGGKLSLPKCQCLAPQTV